jgi:hypothetical protein
MDSKMKKATHLFILIAAFGIFLGCARIGTPSKPLSISDIKGSWEGIHIAFCFLDIDEKGQGYLVFTFPNESDEVYKIQSVTFSPSSFLLTLKNLNENGDILKLNGLVFAENILITNEIEEDGGEEEPLFFIRESIIQDLREKAKETINKYKN